MSMKDVNITVTGGAGFIGSWIAEALAKDNTVKIIDNLHTGKSENIKEMDAKFVKADIRDSKAVFDALKDSDVVFHQGANVQIQASIDDPGMDADINIGGTLNVLEACRKHDIKRLVFASSSAIYGNPEKVPVSEGQRPDPLSPYALSKLAGETYVRLYNQLYGIETVSLRYFNVYGPRQNPDSPYSGVISIFTKNVKLGKRLVVFGDGEQTRDFVNVKDVVSANILAAQSKDAVGKAFNIGTGKSISLNEMISVLKKISGKKLNVVHEKPRKGEVKHSRADIGLAKKILGYEPTIEFEDGLKELL